MYNQKNKFPIYLVVIALIIALIITSQSIASPFRIQFTDFISGPLKAFGQAGFVIRRFLPFAGLRDENHLLRDRLALYERRFSEMKALYEENLRLKGLLDFKKTLPYTTIASLVIGRDPTNWSNSIIIDKGSIGGVRQNKAVLSARGLVGRVVEVGKYSSKVLLITDPNSKVGVLVERNRHGGILIGRPDGMAKMIYIALDSDVAPGDKVLSAGYGSVFPKDIVVGEVVKVEKEPGRLYKFAIVRTQEDMARLENVLCVQ